jgi:hypothetical protein
MRSTTNIGTLTSRDRLEALELTVNLMADGTAALAEPIPWVMVANGVSDRLWRYIEALVAEQPHRQFLFRAHREPVNLGCGGGMNVVWERTNGADYTLLLEDDWLLLPSELTGVGPDWLARLIGVMDADPCTAIYLRRYETPMACRQHYTAYNWSHVGDELGLGGFRIRHQPVYRVSNNPKMYRVADYRRCGIFPQPEFIGPDGRGLDVKGELEWGRAELAMENRYQEHGLRILEMAPGLFYHYDHAIPYLLGWLKHDDTLGCGLYSVNGSKSSCKYGLCRVPMEFCELCDHSRDLRDLAAHDARYIKILKEREAVAP